MAGKDPRTGNCRRWSSAFSPTLDLSLANSRLQTVLAVGGTGLPLAIPFALNLPLSVALGWCAVHAGVGAFEAWRAGLLGAGRRPRRISRNGKDWYVTRADGRTCVGELRRGWTSRWCAYLELRDEGRWPGGITVLVWRDAVDPVAFRHLTAHIRVG